MPWCEQCKCHPRPTACADIRFESATLDAWSALHHFWLSHKALMLILGAKS